MDIITNRRRLWRLVALFTTMVIWSVAQGVYGQDYNELPIESITYNIQLNQIEIKTDLLIESGTLLDAQLHWDDYISNPIKDNDDNKIIILYQNFNQLENAPNAYIEVKYSTYSSDLLGYFAGFLSAIVNPIFSLILSSPIKHKKFKIKNAVEVLKNQIIEVSHQTLDLHDLDKHSSFHKQRHLMAVALAGLGFEAATDAAATLNSLAILLAGLKSLQSHTCNNSDNAYAYNQKDVCKSVSDNSIDVYEDIIEPYTTVAKGFHEGPNSKLRMNETDYRIYIYFPNGNNIALLRDDVEKDDELGEKYNKFKENFTKTASFDCHNNVAGRQCGVFTYNKETLIEDYKKVYPLIHKAIQLDSKIVMYHKDSLICDTPSEVHRRLMQCSDSKTRKKWNKKAVAKDNSNNLSAMEEGMRWCDDKPEVHFNQTNNELTDEKEFSAKTPRFGCEERKQTEEADDKYSQEKKSSELTEFNVLEGQLSEDLREVLTSQSDDCEPHKKSPRPIQEKSVLNKPLKAPTCYKVPQKVGDAVDCDIKLFEHNSSGETKCLARAEREIDIDNPKQDTDKGYCSRADCYMQ